MGKWTTGTLQYCRFLGLIAVAITSLSTVSTGCSDATSAPDNGPTTTRTNAASDTSDPSNMSPVITAVETSNLAVSSTEVGVGSTDPLNWWPPRPNASPSQADVPLFLPARPFEGTDRLEIADLAGTPNVSYDTYIQQFLFGPNGDIVATVRTTLGGSPPPIPQGSVRLEVSGWNEGWIFDENEAALAILVSDVGSMSITVTGSRTALPRTGLDDPRSFAAIMPNWLVASEDGTAGWELGPLADPQGMFGPARVNFQGWVGPTITRTATWLRNGGPVAQLLITVGLPAPTTSDQASKPMYVGEINGHPAIARSFSAGSVGTLVSWSPEIGVTVTFGALKDAAATTELARELEDVSQSEWLSAGEVLPQRTEVSCFFIFNSC